MITLTGRLLDVLACGGRMRLLKMIAMIADVSATSAAAVAVGGFYL